MSVQPNETTQRTRPRPTPRRVTVRAVDHLSPRMRRITFGGDDLAGFAWSGPAAHIKIVFPKPGEDTVPDVDPDGPRPMSRTYTPRRFDLNARSLTVDFVLHGEGPASTWAAQARAGQEAIIMGPARGYPVDPLAPWFVLAADDAALPALETLLDAMPLKAQVTAFIEVAAAEEIRSLTGTPNVDVHWLVRDAEPGEQLRAALTRFAWPPDGKGRVYVGCEALAMRRIRTLLVAASGLTPDRIITRGYWRTGTQNHPDHDYGAD
jgi:NADPH-dependent ferric siderophore reductase